MKSTKFIYVLIDKALKPRLALNQTHLFEYLQQFPDSYVKTFFTKEEASKFIDHHLNIVNRIQSSKASKVQEDEDELLKIQYGEVFQAETEAKAKESSSLNEEQDIEETVVRHNKELNDIFEKEHRISPTNTESVVLDKIIEEDEESGESGETEGKESADKPELKWNAYYFFKEDEKAIEKAKKAITPSESYHLFFDGASSGNPGPCGIGYAIYNKESKKLFSNSIYAGINTNNAAEYYGAIFGMKTCQNLGIKNLIAYGDSQLIVNQINKKYQVKAKHLWKFYFEASSLLQGFESIEFKSVPREQNTVADALSKKGITMYKGKKF